MAFTFAKGKMTLAGSLNVPLTFAKGQLSLAGLKRQPYIS